MRNNICGKIGGLLLCMGVLIISGCVKYLQPEMGAVALDDARVPFVDSKISDAVLATKDLRLEYTLSGNGDTFDIAGKLMIDLLRNKSIHEITNCKMTRAEKVIPIPRHTVTSPAVILSDMDRD